MTQTTAAEGPGIPPTALNDRIFRDMDEDLVDLDRDALAAEVRRLRAGIREHRDSVGQELCWHHPRLWGLLPEKTDPQPTVPEWPQFLRGCVQYRESLDRQLPNTRRTEDEFEGRDTARRSSTSSS